MSFDKTFSILTARNKNVTKIHQVWGVILKKPEIICGQYHIGIGVNHNYLVSWVCDSLPPKIADADFANELQGEYFIVLHLK